MKDERKIGGRNHSTPQGFSEEMEESKHLLGIILILISVFLAILFKVILG